jgi:hypothetical protein
MEKTPPSVREKLVGYCADVDAWRLKMEARCP